MAFAGSSSDEEDMSAFYNRSLPPPKSSMDDTQASISASSSSKKRGGSGGLAPSKSTVYVSNLDYSLTNSDLFTIFSTFGKVARVTVMKDRESRKSKGVAFVLFTKQKDAVAAVQQMQGKSLNGRRLNVSVAADNGRAPEFIRRRVYKDKSRCYECGEAGHLSYECPRNQLGNRERPQPKKPRKAHTKREDDAAASMPWDEENEAEAEAEAVFEDDNWASVVDPRGMHDMVSVPGLSRRSGAQQQPKRPKYFSDDESDPDD